MLSALGPTPIEPPAFHVTHTVTDSALSGTIVHHMLPWRGGELLAYYGLGQTFMWTTSDISFLL